LKRSDDSESDTVLVLQVSTDLAAWPAASDIVFGPASATSGALPGGITYTVTENGAAQDEIVITLPNGGALRKFSRLKATQ
jgi:hypothetical protein